MRRFFIVLLMVLSISAIQARTLRVLAIGNSFSDDAVEQNLYELALAQGDTLIIGNAYIPGCSLERHYDNILSDKPAYSYRKVVDGVKTKTDATPLSRIIADEPWDIVSLQQASHFSGQKKTYSPLAPLKSEVKKQLRNPDAEIVWHMTWAYAKDSTHNGFKNYGNSQSAMNDSIRHAVYTLVPTVDIARIIPSGTAVQNAREVFGDVLNSDGYHLAHELGRYVAACTWCEFLTGQDVTGNPFVPQGMTAADAVEAQRAAHKAIRAHSYITGNPVR